MVDLVARDGNDFATGLRDRYNRPIEAVLGALSRALFGSRDPFCGLKCYGAEFYRRLGRFPSDMHVGTLPLVWARRFGSRVRFIEISVERRLDRPRFGRRVAADLALLRAFSATVWSAVSGR